VGLTEVGQMIRRKRETLKWTQEHLAAKALISPQYLSRIERGTQQPSLFALQKIAEAFESKLILDIPLEKKLKKEEAISKIVSILNEKSDSDILALLRIIEVLWPNGKNDD